MIIFHHNDADGRCAASVVIAALAWSLKQKSENGETLDKDEELLLDRYATKSLAIEVDYSKSLVDPSLVKDGELVVVVDYSFSPATISTLKDLCRKACGVIWIDHHVTSKRILDSGELSGIANLRAIVDTSKCGAYLAWETFMSKDGGVPIFIEYVDLYDRWVDLNDNVLSFHYGIISNNDTPDSELWTNLIKDAMFEKGIEVGYDLGDYSRTNYIYRILNEGKIAYNYAKTQSIQYFRNYGFENETVFGMHTYCVNWKTNSMVFQEVMNDTDLYCVFCYNGRMWTYTLYSNNPNVDCSKIAEKYNGGGHKGAAGFATDHCIFIE